ncbi:Cna B-type domain-containing protein, partial [Bacillus pseudomycoides]|uniref:Cna B-type domain-containing protein n=1 Tax=Bacillus pseudomycoides TaxID=64104 RepID=UPI00119DD6D7
NHPNRQPPPQTIKLHLLQNNKLIPTQQLTPPTHSKYPFTHLPPYHPQPKPYNYQLKQQPLHPYQSQLNPYHITNTKLPQTKLQPKKTSKHHNPKQPPKTIKLHLLQNNKLIPTQQL